jgi:ubiquitin-protein ligase
MSRRVIIDIKSVTENNSLEHWDGVSSIFYNSNETNINKGHFLILGVENSPYFGGFYFFDHTFPDNYPFSPPQWKFLSNDGKTRFNPNLYQPNSNPSYDGKVCLSILNTWGESTWSQVQRLSSVVETIRAHLFHDKPLINEPGYSDKDPMNEIYSRMLYYQNLNFNVYSNIVQTPKYAEPFKQLMKENFLKNKDYFQKYIDDNKYLHNKLENIRYDSQVITYNFEQLEKKFKEIITICES